MHEDENLGTAINKISRVVIEPNDCTYPEWQIPSSELRIEFGELTAKEIQAVLALVLR